MSERPVDTLDPEDLANRVREFEARQASRCAELGIDVTSLGLSHVAFRCRTWDRYVAVRDALEPWCSGNQENVWNGRPISKLLLRDPIELEHGRVVDLVELIPPVHQRVYRMGLEHVGYVVGVAEFPDFVERHFEALTGQQFQAPRCKPVYRLFEDYTHVKFYEESLRTVCEHEGARFDRFVHATWTPELTSPEAHER